MALIRPRLTDHHDLPIGQEDVDFAIPFLDEDIPLCLDPFLLWKSPSMQDNALHTGMINAFNHLGYLVKKGDGSKAREALIRASECSEVGLGFSGSRKGHRLGPETADTVLNLFELIPQIKSRGFIHIEEAQLCVDQVGKDRISDIACSFLKSFLIDYTMQQCTRHAIPTVDVAVDNVYDMRKNGFTDGDRSKLPVNPQTGLPTILVPKRWLRRANWISCDDYIDGYFGLESEEAKKKAMSRPEILDFNRKNYGTVENYIKQKERTQEDCKNDPLFSPIPVFSAKRKWAEIKKIPTGRDSGADKKYEELMAQLLASLLYPHLDFVAEQSRTDSGVHIRDLVFYNNRSVDFMRDIYTQYGSRQFVFEMKNTKVLEPEHINQLNRYLANEFGRFGVFVTRNPLPRATFRNTVDLWSGQRCCVIALTDEDIELMVNVFESKQRLPIEVLKKKYIEFVRACPA